MHRFAVLIIAGLLMGLINAAVGAEEPYTVYLPLVGLPARPSPFGFESNPSMPAQPQIRARAADLGASWVRLNGALWHEVQPEADGAYNWQALARLDDAITTARTLGLTPVVVIRGTPLWAAVAPSHCAAIRDDRLEAFAAFLEELATRYRGQVDYWELGNEPDVDPRLLPVDSPYGCMGDIDDPYYGGERYGRMLQVAAPALRRGNPQARIVFGGLLLGAPSSSDPTRGTPEHFFEGALRAGAGAYFDILAYHAYPYYFGDPTVDPDTATPHEWSLWGGWTLGKARYLRAVMSRYGVDKPLWLNETSVVCPDSWSHCNPPNAAFFVVQAHHLVRMVARATAAGVAQITWYTLEGPGWFSTSLLDGAQQPRPAYHAFQQMTRMILPFSEVAGVDYGPGIEAYRFVKGPTVVDVLWSRDHTVRSVEVPSDRFLDSRHFDGSTLASYVNGSTTSLDIGLAPVYIERKP